LKQDGGAAFVAEAAITLSKVHGSSAFPARTRQRAFSEKTHAA
jgi:hypothetical protein